MLLIVCRLIVCGEHIIGDAMDDIRAVFGERVRELRHAAGLSQEQLADRSGLHRTYVGSVERGERNISLRNIQRLAVALGAGLDGFFGGLQVTSRGSRSAKDKRSNGDDREALASTPLPVRPNGFNPNADLPYACTTEHIQEAMDDFIEFLGLINAQLYSRGIDRIETIMMAANFSSMVGEFVKTAIARHCPGLARNRYHNGHPDLVPDGLFPGNSVQHASEGIEVKASRNDSGWQGHNPEDTWLMVFVFDSNCQRDAYDPEASAYPFRFKRALGARLTKSDWSFSGRSARSRRTITASVVASGYQKMGANWIYQGPESQL